MFASGAQQPLLHSALPAHFAAQVPGSVVVLTQTASAQQLLTSFAQLAPGARQAGAQYGAGAQTAEEPDTNTSQQPLWHWLLLRHVVAQMLFEGSFVSNTHVLPLQQALVSLEQSCPGSTHAPPPSTTAPAAVGAPASPEPCPGPGVLLEQATTMTPSPSAISREFPILAGQHVR